jgi:6-phosphofructokinase 1
MRIGMLTGGGDCPGLNAVIRAVVGKGEGQYGDNFLGFLDGWRGVIESATTPLDWDRCRDILTIGGTILGTSRTNPYKVEGGVPKVLAALKANAVDALIAIGGGRCAQDDRQRSVGHRGDLRLPHRGADSY